MGQVRDYTALAEDLSLDSSTYIGWLTVTSAPGDPMSYSDLCGYSQIQHKFTQTRVKIKTKERGSAGHTGPYL